MKVADLVPKNLPKSRVLMARLWGSRSHNTHLPDSDYDVAGIYVVPTETALADGLIPYPDTVTQGEGDGQDYQFHEVGKFCHLLLKGNPSIVEHLFFLRPNVAEDETTAVYDGPLSSFWLELVKARKRFLSQHVVKQYIGYAQGQMKRLHAEARKTADDANRRMESFGDAKHSEFGFNTKWAYHAMRCLFEAHRIARGTEPAVWFGDCSPQYINMMQIRRGEKSALDVQAAADGMIAEIDALKPWLLPEDGDRAWLADWLFRLRMAELEIE